VLGYEIDLLEEIGRKRLVKTRVLVTAAPNPRLEDLAEHVLVHSPSAGIADDYRPPLDVIFGQLLGLFCSLHYGLKPDCPSPNGAISRVVQNVLIHS
jgi:tagatose-6-phosphate ketose/aldose isomerase